MLVLWAADLPRLHDPDPGRDALPRCARDRTKVKTSARALGPIVTQALIAINVIVFLAETATGASLGGGGGLTPGDAVRDR